MKVHSAIAAIAKAISVEGIAKSGKNEADGYSFRSIDDILDTLSPLLASHDVVILPTVIDRECVERRTASGMALFYVTVRVRYDFVSTLDGSTATVEVFGEAMDQSDKATNKSMTAAYKVAVTQAFCIATKNTVETDQQSPNAAARLTPEERTKHERAILASPTLKLLKPAYDAARAAAVRVADDESKKQFLDAKKAREEALKKADAEAKAKQTAEANA